MNNSLASDRQIIVGKKRIKNWESANRRDRSLVSNCTSLVYSMVDDLGNRHRTNRHIPVSMCGTGMMVRADVIKQLGGLALSHADRKLRSDDGLPYPRIYINVLYACHRLHRRSR
jgi:hypothetical protein